MQEAVCTAVSSEAWAKLREWAVLACLGWLLLSGSVVLASLKAPVRIAAVYTLMRFPLSFKKTSLSSTSDERDFLPLFLLSILFPVYFSSWRDGFLFRRVLRVGEYLAKFYAPKVHRPKREGENERNEMEWGCSGGSHTYWVKITIFHLKRSRSS